ncbi:MAG: hypothetical protein OXG04_16320 [Acidobacteria bacterium]|nr:hypothetical protein [Acidobacteriota bacterium]
MQARTAAGNWRTQWGRRRRRLYAQHRIAANALMIGLMLLGAASQDTVTSWLTAGASAGRGAIIGHLMVRPPEPGGRIRGTIRFEPHGRSPGLAGRTSSVLSGGGPPEAVETTTSHGGRWSIPASALRRGWTYRIEAQAGECPATEAATITVPLLTRARVPPLTAASCRPKSTHTR